MAQCTNNSASLEKKRRQFNETMSNKNVHDIGQIDFWLNENPTRNTLNNRATIVQGPMGDDDKIKSWKAWSMEMLTNNGDILMTMTSGSEQANGDYKKLLCARVTHSNHAIQLWWWM